MCPSTAWHRVLSDYAPLGSAAAQIMKSVISSTHQAFQWNPSCHGSCTGKCMPCMRAQQCISSGLRGTTGQTQSGTFTRKKTPPVAWGIHARSVTPSVWLFQRPQSIFTSVLGILSDRTLWLREGTEKRSREPKMHTKCQESTMMKKRATMQARKATLHKKSIKNTKYPSQHCKNTHNKDTKKPITTPKLTKKQASETQLKWRNYGIKTHQRSLPRTQSRNAKVPTEDLSCFLHILIPQAHPGSAQLRDYPQPNRLLCHWEFFFCCSKTTLNCFGFWVFFT